MLPKKDPILYNDFPLLRKEWHEITSPSTNVYNCLAWAAGDNTKRWDPGYPWYWPINLREVTIDSFVKVYESIGFVCCDDQCFEDGFEKIVIFLKLDGTPTHVARMIKQDVFTSKLGNSYDISHSKDALNGSKYGYPVIYMRRVINKKRAK
jgi:hypothetical protein